MRATRASRRTSRCASSWTTGAGGGCRSTCAPGKRLARRVTEIAVQFKKVPHGLFRAPDGGITPERPRAPHPARRRDRPPLHLQGARAADHPARRRDGLPLRRLVRLEHPRGVRAASPRRHARRGDALHAPRRGRRAVGVHQSRVRRHGRARGTRRRRSTRAGSWGPEQAEDLLARDGRRWRRP